MAHPTLRREVLHGYKRLLRTCRQTFQNDTFAKNSAFQTVRENFEQNRMVTDVGSIRELMQGVEEVESMLRHNIVQGKADSRGVYQVSLSDPQKENMNKDENLVALNKDNPEEVLRVTEKSSCPFP